MTPRWRAETPDNQDGEHCNCPITDGMIYHQRDTCTDPIAELLGWYAS